MTNFKNTRSTVTFGAVCAEIFALRGAKAAEAAASRAGKRDLAEKIRRGEFSAPRGKFGPARAQARAEALKLLVA